MSLFFNRRRKFIFSLVVDNDAKLQYQAYYCVRSLITYGGVDPSDIFVNFTPENASSRKRFFADLGCKVREVARFGDGKWCNKIAQLENLEHETFDHAVLLDCDVVVLADIRDKVGCAAIQAKPVDLPNPSLEILNELATKAGITSLPGKIKVDAGTGDTFLGNCNGGVYVIPRQLVGTIRQEWSRWATWLLANMEPLSSAGIAMHADQVSLWIAIHRAGLPYQPLGSNLNYFAHFDANHVHFDPAQPIFVLHYHEHCMNDQGLLEPRCANMATVSDAFAKANALIKSEFRNDLFWDLRYTKYPERGSGRGSRGENLLYKRALFAAQNIETASGVLDVGCGDLEVLKTFNLRKYLGLDQSLEAIALAKAARPDWEFRQFDPAGDHETIPSRELVFCFEVLIHQPTQAHYRKLIEFAASRADRALLISGYEFYQPHVEHNHLIFFHEPLSKSLAKAEQFKRIEKIGEHTDVTVFRCEK